MSSSTTGKEPGSSVDTEDAGDLLPAAGTAVAVSKGPEPTTLRGRVSAVDRRLPAVLLVAALVASAGFAWWWTAKDDLPDGAAFRLGDQVVTADEVDRRVDALEALYGVKQPEDAGERSDFVRDAAKSMAVQLMLQREAEQRDIVVAAKEVDDTLRTLIEQRYPDGGRPAFISALGELGATEEQVRDEIGDQLLVSKLFDDVAGDVEVSEAELERAFDERKEQLATPVRRSLSNIVVADRAAAQAVLRRLRAGTAFAALARSNSLDSATRDQGGALGAVARADLEKAYGAAAFAAPVGALFGPVRTESGWNVGKVEKVLPARPAEYSSLRDALRETVLAEKSVEKWRAWLKDVIVDNDVTYTDAYRPDDPDSVPDIDQPAVSGGE